MHAHEERRRQERAPRPRVTASDGSRPDRLAAIRPAGNAAVTRAVQQAREQENAEPEQQTPVSDRVASGLGAVNQAAAPIAHTNLYGLGPAQYIASTELADQPGPSHQVMGGFFGADIIDGTANVLGAAGNAANIHKSRKQLKSDTPEAPLPATEKYEAKKTVRNESAGLATNTAWVADDAVFAGNHALKLAGHAGEAVTNATGEAAGGMFAAGAAFNAGRNGRSIVRTMAMRNRVKKVTIGGTAFDATEGAQELARREQELTLERQDLVARIASEEEYLGWYGGREADNPETRRIKAAIRTLETVEIPRVDRQLAEVREERTRRREEFDHANESMESDREYTLGKHKRRTAKDGVSLVGNLVKIGSGVVVILIAAASLSSPVGWALAVAAAVTLGVLGGYKALKAVRKRYELALKDQRKKHQEKSRQAAQEASGQEGVFVADKSAAFREALKFWKSLGNGERHEHAESLLNVAAGRTGEPEQAREAQEFLKALNLGPDHLGRERRTSAWTRLRKRKPSTMTRADWEAALADPEQRATWIAMIANRMRS